MGIIRSLFICICIIANCSIVSICFGELTVVNGVDNIEKLQYNHTLAQIDEKKKSAIVDTSNAADWNVWLKTKEGVLKPNTEYKLFFNYIIDEDSSDNAKIHIIVRELSKITPENDCLRLDETQRGKRKAVRYSFRTEDKPDYSFQMHFAGKFKGKISKFKIEEGSFEKSIPPTSDAIKSDFLVKNLPTGAKEFEVILPRPQKEIVVNATEFGVTENCKDVKSRLNQAIAHCKKIGASKLVLNKGTYFISENGSVLFENMQDFTFDGGGSTLVYYKTGGSNMAVVNSNRIKLQNFNFDWDWNKDPIASIVEIENYSSDSDGEFIDIKFIHYDKYPKKDVRFVIMTPYDIQAKSVGVEGGLEYNFNNNDKRNNPKYSWLSDNQMRVRLPYSGKNFFKKGDFFRLVNYSYDFGCLTLNNNTHLTIENVNIYSCCGHGVAVQGFQQYWHFKNFNIVLPPNADPKRCITSSADHCHIINSKGFFKMENCEFSYGCDDCINMHDNSVFGKKISANTLRGKRHANNLKVGDIVEFRNADYSPTNFNGTVLDIKLVDKKNGFFETSFKEELPEQTTDGFVLFNRMYGTKNVIVRNCKFHSNRARGILILASDITIENNQFWRNEQAAIKIETGYTYNIWCEGFGANNIVIRNNTFDTSNPRGMQNSGFERDIFIGTYMKTDPASEYSSYPILSDILIENNTFKDTFGLTAFIASAGNLTIRNNVFEATKQRNNPRSYRGGFKISNSSNVNILNNTYKKSDLWQNPSVVYDTLSSKKIRVEGNKIEK